MQTSSPTSLQNSQENQLARVEYKTSIRKRYGEAAQFLSTFAPDKMTEYSKSEERCFKGTAPTLYWVGETYGSEVAESFVEIQISDMFRKVNYSPEKQPTPEQIEDMAKSITSTYGSLKVTEFGVFVRLLKSGYFGGIYGGDAITINSYLRRFMQYRAAKFTQYDAEKTRRDAEEYRQKIKEGKTMNWLEWQEYKKKNNLK